MDTGIIEDRQLSDELSEELRCNICFDIPDDPMMTSCDHLFCKTCFDQVENKESCPFCRRDPDPVLPAPAFVRSSMAAVNKRYKCKACSQPRQSGSDYCIACKCKSCINGRHEDSDYCIRHKWFALP